MEHRKLGEGGVEVSAVGLGTWQVLDVRGPAEEDRHEVVRTALEAGVTLFDSSPMYGEAERVLGDALREHGRDRATVATKVWTSDDGEAEPDRTSPGLLRRARRALPGPQPRRHTEAAGDAGALEGRRQGPLRRRHPLFALRLPAVDGRDAERARGLRPGPVQRRRRRRRRRGVAARRRARSRRDRDGPPRLRPPRPERAPGGRPSPPPRVRGRDVGPGAPEVRTLRPARHLRHPGHELSGARAGERPRGRAALLREEEREYVGQLVRSR